jgi:hypothetical protein
LRLSAGMVLCHAVLWSGHEKKRQISLASRPRKFDEMTLFRFTDEYSLQKGLIGDRDIFVYREGFYKGSTVAFCMLTVGLIVRAVVPGSAVRMPGYVFFISSYQLFAGAALAAFAARLSKQRFFRFGNYRVTRAVFAFLVARPRQNADEREKSR